MVVRHGAAEAGIDKMRRIIVATSLYQFLLRREHGKPNGPQKGRRCSINI